MDAIEARERVEAWLTAQCDSLPEFFGSSNIDKTGRSIFNPGEATGDELIKLQKNYNILRQFGELCFASNVKYTNMRYCLRIQVALVDTFKALPTKEVRMPCHVSFPHRGMFPQDVSIVDCLAIHMLETTSSMGSKLPETDLFSIA